jgi:hypothetical protein
MKRTPKIGSYNVISQQAYGHGDVNVAMIFEDPDRRSV